LDFRLIFLTGPGVRVWPILQEIPGTQHFHHGLTDPQFGTAGTILLRDDHPGFRFCAPGVIGQRSMGKQHIRRCQL
jgi:hypothetical protein